jgi:metallophosphoesterase superfamily enzyme
VEDDRTRTKLLATVEELAPETIVFLGDLVHAPRPAEEERHGLVQTLASIRARVVVVLGNHDRGFTRDYAGLEVECCDEWRSPGMIAVHGDKALPSGEHVIAGHVHPALTIFDDAGSGRKMPVFVAGNRLTLLPAFSPMATGFDVRHGLPGEMGKNPKIVVATGKRAVDLGPLGRLGTVRS